MAESSPPTWRQLLGTLITSAAQKQRVADELGVRAYSVQRWIDGAATPRTYSARRLPDLFPEERSSLRRLLLQEFPNLFPPKEEKEGEPEEGEEQIPSFFVFRLLSAKADLEEDLAGWTISTMCLQQLIGRLDKEHVGTEIILFRCTPPGSDGVIRSLYTNASISSSLRPPELSYALDLSLMGGSSLPGEAVHRGEALTRGQDLALPIKRHRRMAGCLLVRSPQPFTAIRTNWIKDYANMMALMFADNECYHPSSIHLQEFPSAARQEELVRDLLGVPTRAKVSLTQTARLFQQVEALLLSQEENHDSPQ